MKTISKINYLPLILGSALLAYAAQTTGASCDIETVCELVEAEKDNFRKTLQAAADKAAEDSYETKPANQSSESDEVKKAFDIKGNKQFFKDARNNIEIHCNYEMDINDRDKCDLEDVIKHCWYENSSELENCKN